MSQRATNGPVLTVIGGGSPGTPVLIEALGEARLRGALDPMVVRLYGRSAERLCAVAEHGRHRLRRLGSDRSRPDPGIVVTAHTRLGDAAAGADLVLCQVRIGGMQARAVDEQLALASGIPGDEGLGPAGLACFLRSRPVIRDLVQQCAEAAPRAVFLMMSSPLGLLTATAAEVYGSRCYGVCELPGVTDARVRAAVCAAGGPHIEQAAYLGLNHQGWLYAFRDPQGRDVTAAALAALNGPSVVGIDDAVIRREGAVPLPYLRLFYHADREVARQRARTETRGTLLASWSEAVAQALGAGEGPDHAAVTRLLGGRDMSWYAEGVVPAIAALLGGRPRELTLNLADSGQAGFPGRVVEASCWVTGDGVEQLATPPLPAGPAGLVARLVEFETAALALPYSPGPEALAPVLARHPMVPGEAIALALGRRLSGTA